MNSPLKLLKRPRRNRKSESIRQMVQETFLQSQDLIAPYFITAGKQLRSPISSLPNQFHLSIDQLLEEVETLIDLGIRALILFPVVHKSLKDEVGSYALNPENHIFETVRTLKKRHPDLTLIADIALDPFTSHGHDGLISVSGKILNDQTVSILCQLALLYSEAGIDIVAPSDMMDGRVQAIREYLDDYHFQEVGIMSYTAKYASSLYRPFREALQSAPLFGDKKTYQMNPGNAKEAMIEAFLDEQEGADFLMVKPASLYLDIIYRMSQESYLPIVAYHVSGEYAMLKAAAEKKWLDFNQTLHETLLGIKRAGANLIITYGAKEIALELRNSTVLRRMEPTDK